MMLKCHTDMMAIVHCACALQGLMQKLERRGLSISAALQPCMLEPRSWQTEGVMLCLRPLRHTYERIYWS